MKMNFSCYGNLEPHCTGISCQGTSATRTPKDPWEDIARFGEKTIGAAQAREIAAEVRRNFV